MSFEFWLFYATTIFVASIIPGPSMLLALDHGIRYGLRGSLATAFGNVSATLIQAGISMVGLGVILTTSATVFYLVKWAGAVYLIYLGIQSWRYAGQGEIGTQNGKGTKINNRNRFMQAFWVAAGNPKAIVFFTALFPQFINLETALIWEPVLLIVTMLIIAFACMMIYSAFGTRLTALFKRAGWKKAFDRLAGSVFIGLGVGLVTSRK